MMEINYFPLTTRTGQSAFQPGKHFIWILIKRIVCIQGDKKSFLVLKRIVSFIPRQLKSFDKGLAFVGLVVMVPKLRVKSSFCKKIPVDIKNVLLYLFITS